MKVIILAAGRGTRLGNLTGDKPKCLLPFGGETILQRLLRLLQECGIIMDDVYIVAGYKCVLLKDCGCHIVINELFDKTDNAYSLGLAMKEVQPYNQDILVLDGDLVFEKAALDGILESTTNSILVKRHIDETDGTGVITDMKGRVSAIGKHIKNCELFFTGMMRLTAQAVSYLYDKLLKEENRRFWYTLPISRVLHDIELTAIITTAWVDGINDYEDYIRVQEILGVYEYKILITGASGFLGKKLCAILERNFKIIRLNRHGGGKYIGVDLLDSTQLSALIEIERPNLIIHTVAIADPDACEANQKLAYQINVETTQKLCDICLKNEIKLIFISTDYVFDGFSDNNYEIDSERRPVNYYGYTKSLAEDLVKLLPHHLIVRIPVLYGYNDDDDKATFVSRLLQQLNNGEIPVYLDNEQVRYPVLTDEVAMAIKSLLQEEGIVQISSKQPITKYEWGKLVAEVFDYDKALICPCNTTKTKSARPLHVKMSTQYIEKKNIVISDIKEGLEILKRQKHCVFKLIYKSKCNESIYDVNVGMFRYDMGRSLAKSIPKEIIQQADCVVPVPNSGLYYAMGLANEIQKPYIQGLIKTDAQMRSFNIDSLASREKVIKSKIEPILDLITGKEILLVDEAIFTGTTLRIVCDMLKGCGVKTIHICIPTPICYSRCRQYMQPDRAVLTEEICPTELAEYFRVDSVSNMSYEMFFCQTAKIKNFMCRECFNQF